MVVNFYTREIFSKRLNSTKQIPAGVAPSLSTECTLNQPTSTTNPLIIITFDTNVEPNFFYCVIPALNRKYFVTSCESLLGNRWLFNLHVDVLGTYCDPLSLTTEYVLRSTNSHNPLLIDNEVPIYADCTIQKIAANRIFTDQISQGMYVVGISASKAEGDVSGGSINYYVLGSNAMIAVMQQIFNAQTYYSGISASEISEQLFKSLFNPGQYIVSVRWYPFQNVPTDASQASTIDVGYWSFPITQGDDFANRVYILRNTSYVTLTGAVNLPFHPDFGSYPFANWAPYSKRIMHFPPFGDISIDDPRYINPTQIAASYYLLCDLISGMGHLVMFAGSNMDTYVAKYSSQIGVSMQYSTYQNNMVNDLSKTIVGSAATDIANMLRESSLSTTLAKVGNGFLTSQLVERSGGSPGDTSQYADNPYIVCIFKNLGVIDVNHQGKPLMENRQLLTINGFCQCLDCDFVCPTVEETEELQRYVKSGFYAEWG